jgi:hypothetical protein
LRCGATARLAIAISWYSDGSGARSESSRV